VANSSVSQVISGRVTSAKIQNRISQIIGKPVAAIWEPRPTLRRVKPKAGHASAGAAA